MLFIISARIKLQFEGITFSYWLAIAPSWTVLGLTQILIVKSVEVVGANVGVWFKVT